METIAVGIGKNVDHKELLTIANGVEDNVISVEDFSFLASAIQTHRDNGCFHTKKQTGKCFAFVIYNNINNNNNINNDNNNNIIFF